MTDQHRNYWTLRQNLRFSSDEKQKNEVPCRKRYRMNPSHINHWTEKDTFCSLAVSLSVKSNVKAAIHGSRK